MYIYKLISADASGYLRFLFMFLNSFNQQLSTLSKNFDLITSDFMAFVLMRAISGYRQKSLLQHIKNNKL